MTRSILIALLAVSIPVVAAEEPDAVPITYEVAAIDGKLFLEIEPEPRRMKTGDQPVSGDRLRTGSSSTATIGVPSRTVVFRLDSKTTCTLAHDRPGVLLHVERGRLRAMFGSYTGTDPRLVTTPSAVLAVRGTDYGIKVAKNGSTEIVVFEGVVEAIDPAGEWPPVRIEAGLRLKIRSDRSPKSPSPHRLSPNDWDRGYNRSPSGAGSSGSMSPDGRGMQSGSSSGAGSGSSGSKRRGG